MVVKTPCPRARGLFRWGTGSSGATPSPGSLSRGSRGEDALGGLGARRAGDWLVAGAVDWNALVGGRHEAAAPVANSVGRSFVWLVEHDDEGGQVLVLGSQSVMNPGADRGKKAVERMPTGVKLQLRAVVIVGVKNDQLSIKIEVIEKA